MLENEEQHFVQEFVSHLAIESFDVAILLRSSGHDVAPVDPRGLCPGKDGMGGELYAVVAHYRPRTASPLDDGRQLTGNPAAGEGCIRNGRETLLGGVGDVQDPEPPAKGQLAVHKVER